MAGLPVPGGPNVQYPGNAARTQLLADALDLTRPAAQEDGFAEASDIMQLEGKDLDNRDFEMMLKDKSMRDEWFAKQAKRSEQELAADEEEQVSLENEIDELTALRESGEDDIRAWQETVKQDDQALREVAESITSMLQARPRLALMVSQDKEIHSIVSSAIGKVESSFANITRRIDGIEGRLREDVRSRVDELQLPQLFERRLSEIQRAVNVADGLRLAAEISNEELSGQLDDVNRQKEEEKAALEAKIDRLQKSMEQLRSDHGSLTKDLQKSDNERSQIQVDLESQVTLVSKLNEDKSSLTDKCTGLGDQITRLTNDKSAAEAASRTATSDCEAALKKASETQDKLTGAEKDRERLQTQVGKQSDTVKALQQHLRANTDHIARLTQERETLKEDLERQKRGNGDLKEQLEAAQVNTSKLQESKQQEKSSLGNRIAQLEQELRETQTRASADFEAQRKDHEAAMTTALQERSTERSESLEAQKTAYEDALRTAHDGHFKELEAEKAAHQAALDKAHEAHSQDLQARLAEYEDALRTTHDEHFQELEAEQTAHRAALGNAHEAHSQDIRAQLAKHEDALRIVRGEHSKYLEAEQTAHQAALDTLHDTHSQELEAQLAEHQNAMATVRQKHTKELTDARGLSQSLQRQIQVLKDDKRRFESISKDRQNQVNKLTAEKMQAEEEIKALTIREKQAVDAVSNLRNQGSDYEESLDRVFKEKDELGNQVAAMRLEKDRLVQDNKVSFDALSQLMKLFAKTCSGISVGDDLLKKMIGVQVGATEHRQKIIANAELRIKSNIPRMLFVPDIVALEPVIHAIRFWLSVHAGEFSFGDTQALFNAEVIGMESVEAYTWISEALHTVINSVHTWKTSLRYLKQTLTVLQGIAYLYVMARGVNSPLDDIRGVHDKMRRRLNTISQKPSMVAIVLRKVTALIEQQQPLISWVSGPISPDEAARRLDGSNSDIGANRWLVADTFRNSFVLIEQVNSVETLYAFGVHEVDFLVRYPEHTLNFRDGHTHRLPTTVLRFESKPFTMAAVHRWVQSFLSGKYR
ncbi:MAG: hypothetical protein Q9170_006859, partial [Blastenia crenularia]